MVKAYLGIDVGSVSTNVVAIDESNQVLFHKYLRTNGQSIDSIKKGLESLKQKLDAKYVISGVGTTGSGRQIAGVMVGADVVKNEISAHAVAAIQLVPNVRTIFEIGGQDSKIIFIKDKMVSDFAMNTVCAAGTGSFLDHQAERLGIEIEQFGEIALTSSNDVRIAGRCTVFAESDMIAKQQYGFSKADIINGLANALVRNYINNLARGKKLEPPFVFQGGVAANIAIKAAFEKEVGHKVIVPKYHHVMGAIGSAILAREEVEKTGKPTNFKGFHALQTDFTPSSFICHNCSNLCEVIKVKMNGETVAMWGDRCGMWQEKVHQSVS
ncbi:acyl-CoA dehydratase activase [Tepidibacillus decaturensis]|uniref:2-hydroxyglutaryl-CoA dehydratase n=2 Tax=Tepidibacillus TaxID=1494427 RepID=A0A135L4Z9_9BACI|nr:acyl-CoA dehydratase activase [Tepidibacillus decaturensis]KXG44084.1 2-hydroxyglutaryl-CoA dehydratase [Tepidibacillus decaturensis]